MALDHDGTILILVEEGSKFFEVRGATALELGLAGCKQQVAERHYQTTIGLACVQVGNLPLQVVGLAFHCFRFEARGVGFGAGGGRIRACGLGIAMGPICFACARVEASPFALLAQPLTLVLIEAALGAGAGDVHLAVGHQHEMPGVRSILAGHLGSLYRGFGFLDLQLRAAGQFRIGLELRQLAAGRVGTLRCGQWRRARCDYE